LSYIFNGKSLPDNSINSRLSISSRPTCSCSRCSNYSSCCRRCINTSSEMPVDILLASGNLFNVFCTYLIAVVVVVAAVVVAVVVVVVVP